MPPAISLQDPKAYHTLTRSYILPLHTGNSVRNDACLQCHTPNRTVTPRNDLIVPHDQHYLNGISCVHCHKGVTHGQIDERNQTIDGNFDKWTPEFARPEMALGNLLIGMKECMECHQTKGNGPLLCVVCHKNMQQHGLEALLNIETCEKCHNYTNVEGKPLRDEEKDVTKYARENSFCVDCHLMAASPHEEGWTFPHCFNVSWDDAVRCLICHEMNQLKVDAESTVTYCSKCHVKNLGPAFIGRSVKRKWTTMSHP